MSRREWMKVNITAAILIIPTVLPAFMLAFVVGWVGETCGLPNDDSLIRSLPSPSATGFLPLASWVAALYSGSKALSEQGKPDPQPWKWLGIGWAQFGVVFLICLGLIGTTTS